MAVKRVHVVGSGNFVTTELIAPGDSRRVRSILLANAEEAADAGVQVSLFLETPTVSGKSAADQFYILRNVNIPPGASLLLDNPNILQFSASTQGLYITCLNGNEVDVTIN